MLGEKLSGQTVGDLDPGEKNNMKHMRHKEQDINNNVSNFTLLPLRYYVHYDFLKHLLYKPRQGRAYACKFVV